MYIRKLPVYMLGACGHAGIDWAHSLLDNHKQILIMPAFSFFRTLHKIETINKINLKKLDDCDFAAKTISDMFYFDRGYTAKRRKIIFNKNQKIFFQTELCEYLKNSKENSIVKLFFGIHHAFCKIHNINLKDIKCIVAHEHVSWHFHKYFHYFNAKMLLIFRDPRASLGGGILKMGNVNKSKIINSFQLDSMILDMMSTYSVYSKMKNNNKMFFLKNEKMHVDLEGEMKRLAKWMNIDYRNSLLEQTFMGQVWLGESAYLTEERLQDPLPKNFYSLKEMEKRWREVLSKNDIVLLEVIFRNMIKEFNYTFDNSLNFFQILLNYLKFFFKYQHQEKYHINRYLIILRNIIRRVSILMLKEKTVTIWNVFKFK